LLTLSRYQRGEPIPFTELSIQEIIQTATKRLQPIIESSGAKITASQKDITIEGDHDSLTGLLVILIENAIKYSPDQPQINITAAAEHRQLILRVTDKGAGIKAADLPRIFDRFFRADSSRSKVTTGYGLGLALAAQITDMHSGSITATSKPSHGTTMTIKLPLRQPKLPASLV
jgi:signal transduction histidine kinase